MSKTTFIVNGVDVLKENAKMKQALEEIREITETITPYKIEDKRGLDKILNKINEVLGAEE